MSRLPLTISEADFQEVVTRTAELLGWRWCHFFPLPNRRGRYQTPVQGHVGMPDIVLAKGGVVLLVELKRQTGARVSPAQRVWLEELGEHGRLWYPSSWNSGEILETLRSVSSRPNGPSGPAPRSRAASPPGLASGTGR